HRPPPPPWGKHKDSKFANDYQIPVEVLRDGLPLLLRDAQDDEVRGGNLVRVATADGLALALSQQALGSDPLQVYLVHYIAPKEAQRIESMVEDMKEEPQAEAGGAAAAGAPFVIVNERVLQAKALALMAMRGEITDINTTMEEVRAKEQAPYYITKTSLVDHGLQAGDHLKRLKKAYFASRALAGHFNVAKATLKRIDRALFESLFQSFPMTGMEEQDHLMELAAEYQQ
ncbi:uncharacterized protein, partial [Miscanthus floridulus]|uniref:uncharacterized protein n=1 Tax=Miscanthus floridulus TaxID=154761 RepID=UPI003457967A